MALATELADEIAAHAAGRAAIPVSPGSAKEISQRLAAHDEQRHQLADLGEIVSTVCNALTARIDETGRRDRAAQRREAYEKARAARGATALLIETEGLELQRRARALLREIALAQILINRANADLPEDAAPIAGVESGRQSGDPGPAPSVEEIPVAVWCDIDNHRHGVVGEPNMRNIDVNRDGTPMIDGRTKVWPVDFIRVVHKRYTSLPGLKPLAASLALPPLKIGAAPGWRPLNDGARPEAVLAALCRLDEDSARPASPIASIEETLIRADVWARRGEQKSA